MESEIVISKIKKLLALSTSSNVNEAQNAMLKAQALMIKNGLTIGDVSPNEVKKEVSETSAIKAKRFPWYAYSLSAILAGNFRCYPITERYQGVRYIKFVGLKEDVDAIIEVYNFAFQYLKNQVSEYRQKITANIKIDKNNVYVNGFCNDFARGFLTGLDEKFAKQVEQQEWGLVLVKDEEVEKYHKSMHPKKAKKHYPTTMESDEAWASGYRKGKNFEMVSGVLN